MMNNSRLMIVYFGIRFTREVWKMMKESMGFQSSNYDWEEATEELLRKMQLPILRRLGFAMWLLHISSKGGHKLQCGINFDHGGTGVFDTGNMTTQIGYRQGLIKDCLYQAGFGIIFGFCHRLRQ